MEMCENECAIKISAHNSIRLRSTYFPFPGGGGRHVYKYTYHCRGVIVIGSHTSIWMNEIPRRVCIHSAASHKLNDRRHDEPKKKITFQEICNEFWKFG
jgi:hypothetical protein